MKSHQYSEYRQLQDTGVKVTRDNRIRPNTGSETIPHLVSKSLAGLIGLRNGYRVDSEVDVTQDKTIGEVDTLLWGHAQRLTYAVESETSPTEETIQEKQAKYVDGTAIDDIQIINVSNLPMDMVESANQIADELGLEL